MARKHAGVVGSPIAHSLSPVLHTSAYRALGLSGWEYHREEVREGELTAYLAARSEHWQGLSVTRPGKEEALAVAVERSDDAGLTGAANTLVRTAGGWAAHNTDVDGMIAALLEAGCDPAPTCAWLLGSGATARSALVALARLGVRDVVLQVRDRVRPEALALARRLGQRVHHVGVDAQGERAPRAIQVAVSTVPAGSALPAPADLELSRCTALDVVYSPWPTLWAGELTDRGARVVDGSAMLLHQAARQVELMTGRPAPVEPMRQALREATTAPAPGSSGALR